MIPSTVATLISFVVFVAPGILWDMLVARRKPSKTESAFHEVSRIALFSTPFSAFGVASTMSLIYVAHRPWLSQLASWIRNGRPPTSASIVLGAVLVVVELLFAGGALTLTWWQLAPHIYGTATVREESAWTYALKKPAEADEVWATVRLTSGDSVRGRVLAFTSDFGWADRELTLGEPLSVIRADRTVLPLFDQFIVLPAASIEYVAAMIPPRTAVDSLPDASPAPGGPSETSPVSTEDPSLIVKRQKAASGKRRARHFWL